MGPVKGRFSFTRIMLNGLELHGSSATQMTFYTMTSLQHYNAVLYSLNAFECDIIHIKIFFFKIKAQE